MKKLLWLIPLSLSIFLAFFLFACHSRWPLNRTRLGAIQIHQKTVGDKTELVIDIPNTTTESTKWPKAQLEELGDGVVIIRVMTGGAGSLIGSTGGPEKITVPRVVGKKYVLLIRDEQNVLRNVAEFQINE